MVTPLALLASSLLASAGTGHAGAEDVPRKPPPERLQLGAALGVVHPYGFTEFYDDLDARRGLGLGAHGLYDYPIGAFTLSPGVSGTFSWPQTTQGSVWSATGLLAFRASHRSAFLIPYVQLGFGIGYLQVEQPAPNGRRGRATSFGAFQVGGGLGLALGESYTLGPYVLFENIAVTLPGYERDDAQLVSTGVELEFRF